MGSLYHVLWHDQPVSDTGGSRASLTTVFGIAAAMDLLTGLVLSVIGVSQDIQELAIVGVLLLLSGGAVMAYVQWQKNKPEAL
jgi:threonine/homoserine/homoserine lactone efflux protein